LGIFAEEPEFENKAVHFLKNLQKSDGGFSNIPGGIAKISYTYDCVFALDSLDVKIPRSQDIGEFILNNQMDNGGFLEYNLDNKEGLHTTFWAVRTLEYLGIQYDKEKVVGFANEVLTFRMDGGFGNYPGVGSNVRFTFDAVSVLDLIGRGPSERDEVVGFINGLRNEDGGFGENDRSNIETTYRAVLTLRKLEEPINETEKTIDYIRKSQNNDGGFGFAREYVSRGSYTYRAIRTLDILGYEPLNTEGAIHYLLSLENEDGGFGNYLGEDDSDVTSTYRAIRALNILHFTPTDVDRTENFILDSQNPNGGFRRSPYDSTAPANFSKSIFTYNAVLGLHFLGRPIQEKEKVYSFLMATRNPDLGYAEMPFFTSTVASTFTSLWASFYLFPQTFNSAPLLNNHSAIFSGDSKSVVEFRVEYLDPEGQAPEYVHLILDGLSYAMEPASLNGGDYEREQLLPFGNHSYFFVASDGLMEKRTEENWIESEEQGNPPRVTISVDPEDGDKYTTFTFTASYANPDGEPPVFMEIELDRLGWDSMNPIGSNLYVYTINLQPGKHTVRVRTSDGSNLVYSDTLSKPWVYSLNATRPDWTTFLKIQQLIFGNYGEWISYGDVQLDTRSGELVWRVTVQNETVFVSYDGTSIIGNDPDPKDFRFYAAAFTAAILVAVLFMIIITSRRKT